MTGRAGEAGTDVHQPTKAPAKLTVMAKRRCVCVCVCVCVLGGEGGGGRRAQRGRGPAGNTICM
jgi:hypothetical protein